MELICPICGRALSRQEKSLRCPENHSFDIARQGYVNLLPVQQKHSQMPGDTRQQVLSRRAFLDAGFYQPVCDALIRVARAAQPRGEILDVGCGEGYYSARLAQALNLPLTGLDISKEAVRCAAARYKEHRWICATAAHIPVERGSVGVLASLFSVTLPEEFRRVLSPEGVFLQVLAAEDHLLGLKAIIYDEVFRREKNSVPELPGFRRVDSVPIRFTFTLEGEQVTNLLSMTPHVYRIGREGARRLTQTQSLTDTASCVLNVFRPL